MKVFLGGTCNGSGWRDQFTPSLTIDFFNPVVAEWNDEAQERELRERETADFVLYAITPLMTGFYSIAEVVDDSNKRPEKTVFVLLGVDGVPETGDVRFSPAQAKSLDAVGKLVRRNGGQVFYDLVSAANYMNRVAKAADELKEFDNRLVTDEKAEERRAADEQATA